MKSSFMVGLIDIFEKELPYPLLFSDLGKNG
jgi:hypothetical protein